MNKKQKRMIDQAFATSDCKVKKLSKCELVDKLAYIAAKIEDVLALEEGDPEERPITVADVIGIGAKK